MSAATGERPVGIAFEEFNHDLHPDPRNELLAPSLAGPRLRNPDRAGLLGLAIPIELHPDVADLSVDISSCSLSFSFTTFAVWIPWMRGFGVNGKLRNWRLLGRNS